MMERLKTIPRPGMRIIKSAVAVGLCYLISLLRTDGIVFYSQLAALWCMQNYLENTKKNAAQRFIGTLIGAVYGLIFLLVFLGNSEVWNAAVITVLVGIVLYTTAALKKKQASYFSCVVFLSIVVNHANDINPYLFVFNRCMDTVIGIIVGVAVNEFSLPRKKHKDILFVSGLDDTLLKRNRISDYSRVELNRMLDEGLNFTISTCRTPASLLDPTRDIRLKLPVIAMDGAVLYDLKKNRYMKCYLISNAMAKKIDGLIRSSGLSAFVNVIIENTLVICYEETGDAVHQKLVEALSASPLRNYIPGKGFGEENVVYFMLLYPDETIGRFYACLEEEGITASCKVVREAAEEYPGYSYLKIYNKNASKANMLHYLEREIAIEKTVTFGSIEGRYDVYVPAGDVNSVVKEIRRRFEPVRIGRRREA